MMDSLPQDVPPSLTRAQLEEKVCAAVNVKGAPSIAPCHLAVLEQTELECAVRRMDQLLNACGCAEGGVTTMICLLVGLARIVQHPPAGLLSRIGVCVLVVFASLLAGGLGKLLGLAIARARWLLERGCLMRRVNGRRKGGRHVVLR